MVRLELCGIGMPDREYYLASSSRMDATRTRYKSHVATLLHLANTAIRTGRKLRYDPAKEQFVGDELANRYVNLPMRAPWHL